MKLRSLAVLSLLLPALASARNLPAGTFQLGGDASLSFSSATEDYGVEEVDVDTFQLGADGLFYVVPNLGVGAFFDYYSQSVDDGFEESDFSMTLLGPQVSYNLSVAPQLSVFGTFGLGYASQDFDGGDASGFGWKLGGGLRFFPVDAISLDGTIGYQSVSLEDDFDNEADFSDLRLGVGLTLYFGGR